jgi:hypothetical protein
LSTFFDDQPLNGALLPSPEELAARMFPPAGFEGAFVVQVGEHVVWKRKEDLADTDLVCFYDGDCRDVLTPDDPRLAA